MPLITFCNLENEDNKVNEVARRFTGTVLKIAKANKIPIKSDCGACQFILGDKVNVVEYGVGR